MRKVAHSAELTAALWGSRKAGKTEQRKAAQMVDSMVAQRVPMWAERSAARKVVRKAAMTAGLLESQKAAPMVALRAVRLVVH